MQYRASEIQGVVLKSWFFFLGVASWARRGGEYYGWAFWLVFCFQTPEAYPICHISPLHPIAPQYGTEYYRQYEHRGWPALWSRHWTGRWTNDAVLTSAANPNESAFHEAGSWRVGLGDWWHLGLWQRSIGLIAIQDGVGWWDGRGKGADHVTLVYYRLTIVVASKLSTPL